MQITQKGQVTIPGKIRHKYGLLPYTQVEFIEEKGRVYLELSDEKHRGARIVSQLRGKATVRMSTDEIMALTRGKK